MDPHPLHLISYTTWDFRSLSKDDFKLRVPGFTYVAIGNSTSKKDAQTHAARDFLNFCVRSGRLQQHEVPEFNLEAELETAQAHLQQPPPPVFPAPGSGRFSDDTSHPKSTGDFRMNAYVGVGGHRPMDPNLILQQRADVESVSTI
ncbi:ATP-dependent RNA helicase A-like isoform X2 [Convolutriloba macropyga]|uniref:ATP-dependent RNA helicase A-like isoform X2 n=1 Tax=Convolutriloba macropyga TaxID=536237 RepID=UPI003F51DBCC